MTKSVTDGRGTTHFFEVFNGKNIIGRAMVFVPTAVSMVESASGRAIGALAGKDMKAISGPCRARTLL